MKSGKKVKKAVYLRVSCADGRQDSGLDSQRTRAMKYCEGQGYSKGEIKLYEDKISGGRSSRPALDKMLEDCREGLIDTIIVVSLSRLSRSMAHMVSLTSELSKLNIKLISIQESLDFSTAMGQLVLNIMTSLFEMEKSLVSIRVRRGLAHAKSCGKRLGRSPKVDKKLVIGLYEEGLSYRQISKATKSSVSNCHRIVKAYLQSSK